MSEPAGWGDEGTDTAPEKAFQKQDLWHDCEMDSSLLLLLGVCHSPEA